MLRFFVALLVVVAGPVSPPLSPSSEFFIAAAAESAGNGSSGDSYDWQAERQLLDMTNAARTRAGVPPLRFDETLTRAAREHSAAMADAEEISHQLPREPSLSARLSADSSLHLDHMGENVSMAADANQSQEGLMHSPPHRENILDPGYNIIGIGVVRRGPMIYVTEDFGHNLPIYSAQEAEDLMNASIDAARRSVHLSPLRREPDTPAQSSACAMAHADSLNAPGPTGRYVLRYTTSQPATLPDSAVHALQNRDLHAFSIGVCYARTPTYPSGAYWSVLVLY